MCTDPIGKVRDKTAFPSPGRNKPHSTAKQPGGSPKPPVFSSLKEKASGLRRLAEFRAGHDVDSSTGRGILSWGLAVHSRGTYHVTLNLVFCWLPWAWTTISGDSITSAVSSCHAQATLKPLPNLPPRSKLLLRNTTVVLKQQVNLQLPGKLP